MLQSPIISVAPHKPHSGKPLFILYWWAHTTSRPEREDPLPQPSKYLPECLWPSLLQGHGDDSSFNLLFTRTALGCFFFWQSAFQLFGPPPVWKWVASYHLQDLALGFVILLSAHFLIIVQLLWEAALLSIVQPSHNLVSPENLLGYSVLFFRLLIKTWHTPGASMRSWGTTLITAYQVNLAPLTIALSAPLVQLSFHPPWLEIASCYQKYV